VSHTEIREPPNTREPAGGENPHGSDKENSLWFVDSFYLHVPLSGFLSLRFAKVSSSPKKKTFFVGAKV